MTTTASTSPAIIVACTRDFSIGRNGDLLYHISDDLKRFKALTMGHPIIMGRRTFESFPKGALPGRRNIVITRNLAYTAPGIEIAPSLEAALAMCDPDGPSPYIIGGGEIYSQALSLVDRVELTLIDATASDADTRFPRLESTAWEVVPAEASNEVPLPFDPVDINCPLTDPRTGIHYAFLTLIRK